VASLVPRDVIVQRTPSEFDDLSDAELIATMKAEIAELERDHPEIRNIKPREYK
jgi:hypothetical protein